MLRTGVPWLDQPECYGNWNTNYKIFNKLSKNNLFKLLFERVRGNIDVTTVMIDSTSCKAHQHRTGARKDHPDSVNNQHIGMSRGGRNTKIHAIVNSSSHLCLFK